MRGFRRFVGFAAAAAAVAASVGSETCLTVQAQTEVMEDGTLFDPVWFREQYSEVEGNRKLAHRTEEKAAEDESAAKESEPAEEDESAVQGSESAAEENESVAKESESAEEDESAVKGSESASAEDEPAAEETADEEEDVQESERTMISTADLSVRELYRLYQLYGQRDGLQPYDSEQAGIMLREQKRASAELKSRKDKELGVSWEVITAGIYDTDTVHVWNTEYLISSETSSRLQEIIDRFENEGYEIGFVLVDITTGDAISYHAGAEIYSASVIKAPYIFSLMENGVVMTKDIYLAGNQSDNDAYVRIRNTYGNQVFIDWLEGTGVPKEQGNTRYIMTTPLDLCRMFYKGTGLVLGDSEASEWARTIFTDSLNSAAALTIGTDENKKVYSKAGWIATEGGAVTNSYTNGAIVDGEYPYVVTVMSNSMGYIGVEYAKELMPILDEIHDEMVNPEKAGESSVTAGDISDFADSAKWAAKH